MADDAANALAVRLALLHALLSAAHFTRRDHLHGARDLLRILHASDLFLDFFTNSHVSSLLPVTAD
jgi:hypothetical protein